MFDYVFVEEDIILPELPEIAVEHWGGSQNKIAFQTKDTPNQGLRKFVIGNDGILYIEEFESTFEEDNSIIGFKETRTNVRLESTYFTGKIRFYDSVQHEDYTFDEYDGFESGWIEYLAEFRSGVLLKPIELKENTPARKLTEEELKEKLERREKARLANRARFIESRKTHPTPHQKVIDNIAREVKIASSIPTMEDYGKALNNIELFIKEYREIHDPFYTD